MSALTSLKDRVIALQTTRWWWVLAALATVSFTLRDGRSRLIYRDADGDWVSRQGGDVFHSPAYNGRSAGAIADEAQDIWAFHEPLRPGETVVDIGAGGGEETLWLSRSVGPEGRVIAIEAHPRTFRCLKKTVERNGLHNVIPVHCAVADREGVLIIEDGDVSHLSNRVRRDGQGVKVESVTLDQLAARLGVSRMDAIKINIEGAEVLALEGAPAALKSPARWISSCHDFIAYRPGNADAATHDRVRNLLTAAGLRLAPARQDGRAWIPYYVYAWATP